MKTFKKKRFKNPKWSRKTHVNYRGQPCIDCSLPVDHDWYSHRRCRACNTIYVKNRYDPIRNQWLVHKRMYGIDIHAALKKTPNCGICSASLSDNYLTSKLFAVDHDHVTGKIRGLLCNACNRGIGLLGDSTLKLTKAIEWLNNPPGIPTI